MMIDNGDGTYTAGPFDVLCIQHDQTTGRYHAAFYEERPMPGPIDSTPKVLRLKSKMHHTGGADTFEGAVAQLDDLAKKIICPEDTQVWRDEDRVVALEQAGPDVMVVPTDAVAPVGSTA